MVTAGEVHRINQLQINYMIKTALFVIFLVVFASCTAAEPVQVDEIQIPETDQVEQGDIVEEVDTPESVEVDNQLVSTETAVPTEEIETRPSLENTSGPDCYGSEPNEIGSGISDSFPETSYEQIMTWFCNGAEFEDILVALQTEKLTDFPAGEMLLMLADDWTWDEVWQVIGLTEE